MTQGLFWTWLPQIGSTFPLSTHTPLVNKAAAIMEDDLMFSMEEEEGSTVRPPVQRSAPSQRTTSLCDANTSDDDNDDEEHLISPILDDSTKEICNYLKNLVYTRQLSNSLPKTNFAFKVRHCQK